MNILETVLINKKRRNYIAGFEMLNDNYAILMLYVNGGTAMQWTYNIVTTNVNDAYEIETLIFSDSLKEAIQRTEKIISLTPDFAYSYDDKISKTGTHYKKRHKEKTSNLDYKKRYTDLLTFLKTL